MGEVIKFSQIQVVINLLWTIYNNCGSSPHYILIINIKENMIGLKL